jgi:ferritin-like metal-binding protein YciE
MRDRLAGDFDEAVEASLQAIGKEASETLDSYVADAHALEEQSIQLLERGVEMAGDPALARIYKDHLKESREHARLIEDRLDAMGESRSAVKDAGLRLGGLSWSLFFKAQGDTSAKLAAFVYAVEHLEIAGYELLRRVAQRAGDAATVQLAVGILADERDMAERVFGAFDRAFEASMGG